MRVVSLIASSTEIVCALGLEGLLVGRSHECDFPLSVKKLPQLSEPKFWPDGKSYAIDAQVRAIVQEGLSVYRIDADRLRDLQPDVILTQIQCEVCAVSQSDVLAALAAWSGPSDPQVVALNPNRLEDLWIDIQRVARALQAEERGSSLIAELQGRIQTLSTRALARSRPAPPRVACIEWIDPLMTAGNWMPQLLQLAGAHSLFGEAGKHSPLLEFEVLAKADPDVILISPCGFDNPRTLHELSPLLSNPGWAKLRAVRDHQVYLADGNAYFNRPGPRLVESLEILCEVLYPDAFPARFNGESGWLNLTKN
jgi:iron complex transport system substrate-binding protein